MKPRTKCVAMDAFFLCKHNNPEKLDQVRKTIFFVKQPSAEISDWQLTCSNGQHSVFDTERPAPKIAPSTSAEVVSYNDLSPVNEGRVE